MRVEFDVEPRDRFGRSLVYLYKGNRFINGELVRDGFARAKKYRPNVQYADDFRQLEAQAKAKPKKKAVK